MQRDEILNVLKIFEDTYDVNITNISAEVWYMALKDFDYKDVQKATFEYIRIGKYKPKPADIVDLILNSKVPQQPEELNPQEAWSLVYKAICNSAYNSIKEFEKLPEIVQKAVGSADNLKSMAIDSDFNFGVEQSQFIKVYNTMLERKSKEYQLRLEEVKKGNLPLNVLTTATIEKTEDKILIEENIK